MRASYAFFSVKGGVGKSAIATAAAVAYAHNHGSVAVVDGDLTGTSLGDGLALRAPELATGEGLAWAGPPGERLGRPETLARRRDLSEGMRCALPYFDALVTTHPRPVFDPVAAAWLHDDAPTVRWYPSSPAPQATTRAVEVLMREGTAGKRVRWALERISNALGDEGVLLVDLPPGMFGVGTWVAEIPNLTPVLVTTDDRNDLYRSVHEFARLRAKFPTTRWVLNRNRRSPNEVREDLRAYLGPLFPRVEQDLRELGWSPELEAVFREDRLHVSPELATRLRQLLEGR